MPPHKWLTHSSHKCPTHISHECPISILYVCAKKKFHKMNINVPASVGAPPLDTQQLRSHHFVIEQIMTFSAYFCAIVTIICKHHSVVAVIHVHDVDTICCNQLPGITVHESSYMLTNLEVIVELFTVCCNQLSWIATNSEVTVQFFPGKMIESQQPKNWHCSMIQKSLKGGYANILHRLQKWVCQIKFNTHITRSMIDPVLRTSLWA